MEGQYEFYVTDGSYDALEFSMGKWHLIEEFDAQNARPENEISPKRIERKNIYRDKTVKEKKQE